MVRHETAGEDAMFVASPRTGQIEPRDFSMPDAAVKITERNLDLINCLSHMAAVSMREGTVKMDKAILRERYKDRAGLVVAGARQERNRYARDARFAFARASGYYALVDSGLVNEDEAAAFVAPMFVEFTEMYYGAAHHDEARDYIKVLSSQVKDINLTVGGNNRTHGLRPHKREPKPKVKNEPEVTRELRSLSSRERMQAIQFDPRAGFLPANNSEKNTIMSWLDYFDNPAYPLGIGNQVLEVMVHQQKERTRFEAVRAAESIAWEVGDMVADAADAYERLEILREYLDGISPSAKLAEIDDLDPQAINHLLRYEATENFVKTGETGGLRDVLLAKEDRWVKGGSDPGKHKTVHSHFTVPENLQLAATLDYIADRSNNITVKETNVLIKRASPNEFTRLAVGLRCLDDLESSITGEYRIQDQIGYAIRASRSKVADKPVVKSILNERAKQAA